MLARDSLILDDLPFVPVASVTIKSVPRHTNEVQEKLGCSLSPNAQQAIASTHTCPSAAVAVIARPSKLSLKSRRSPYFSIACQDFDVDDIHQNTTFKNGQDPFATRTVPDVACIECGGHRRVIEYTHKRGGIDEEHNGAPF